jgi:hypothetical protein
VGCAAAAAAAAAAASAGAPCDEAAVRLNSTLIFEDQLGARHALADFSANGVAVKFFDDR